MRKILVIDDQLGIRLLLDELFKKEGYKVQLASNGSEGLQYFEQFAPDCILLDMKMPGIDGITVLKKLNEKKSKTPVFLMTAYEEFEQTKEALQLGALKYFAKPFDIFKVRDEVNALFTN